MSGAACSISFQLLQVGAHCGTLGGAAARKFDRLLVLKVSRLARDMREVISTVYELADLARHWTNDHTES